MCEFVCKRELLLLPDTVVTFVKADGIEDFVVRTNYSLLFAIMADTRSFEIFWDRLDFLD